MTVAIAASFVLFIIAARPGPVDTVHARLELQVIPASPLCGAGESLVLVDHMGGEGLHLGSTTILVTNDGVSDAYSAGSALGIDSEVGDDLSPFVDGLQAGEEWGRCYTVPDGGDLSVLVYTGGKDAQVVAATSLPGSTGACAPDIEPPEVLGWLQTPPDVTGMTDTGVEVIATIFDLCASLPPTDAPHLHYRISDGTNPAFVDAGAMGGGPTDWTGAIPALPFGSSVGDILEYKMVPVADSQGNELIESETIQDPIQCTDVTPPTVSAWVQAPADLTSAHVGAVTVTLQVADDCSGIDQTDPNRPHLWHRLNDGSDPAFIDAGPMAAAGPGSFDGTVPAQLWGLQGGKTLEYQALGVKDLAGRVLDTSIRGDLIELITVYTYIDCPPLALTKGSVLSCAAGRSATDGGAEATLVESGTATSSTTSDLYATSLDTASTATGKENATGVPDSQNAVLPSDGVFVRVGGFAPAAGAITDVRVCYALKAVGTPQNDKVRVTYLVGSTTGTTRAQFTPSTTEPAACFTVFGDRASWTTSDITNLQLEARYVVSGPLDAMDVAVDALYLRVSTGILEYTMDIELGFTAVPAGVTQVLEIAYRTVDDEFDIEVWNVASSAYVVRFDNISAAGSTVTTYDLLADWNAGAPRIRLTDFDPTGTTQGQFIIDYIRVRTN